MVAAAGAGAVGGSWWWWVRGWVWGPWQRICSACVTAAQLLPGQVKEARTFQVELQYPSPKDRPTQAGQQPAGSSASAASPTAAAATAAGGGGSEGRAAAAAARPSFSDLLRSSLHTQVGTWRPSFASAKFAKRSVR